MKYFITIIFILLSFAPALSCEIELCNKFITLENTNLGTGQSQDGIIRNSNCSEDQQKKVLQFLTQTQGTLRASMLQKYFEEISFTPASIEIQKISQDLIQSYGQAPYFLSEIKTHFHKSSLCIEDSNASTSCESCGSPGRKNITLFVRGNKINYTIPIEATLKTKVRAYRIGKTFAPTEILSPTAFTETDFLTDSPSQIQVNMENIRFFSATHTLNQGEILKISDIMPATIIKPGKMARVVLKNEGLQIQTEGRPMQAGSIGQSVQVQLKNKTVSALATDFDEVTVEL